MEKIIQNGRDLSERLVVWRRLEKIEADKTWLQDIARLWSPLLDEIRAYPIGVDLSGPFMEVCARLRQELALPDHISGKFDIQTYITIDGRDVPGSGVRALRDFEQLEKTRMFTRTRGFISPGIQLEEKGFLELVKAKDATALLSAAYPFYVTLNDESADRCHTLLTFEDGELVTDPLATESIEFHHSRWASPRQSEFYYKAVNLLSELIALGEKYGALEALRGAIVKGARFDLDHDRRWLDLIGASLPDEDTAESDQRNDRDRRR